MAVKRAKLCLQDQLETIDTTRIALQDPGSDWQISSSNIRSLTNLTKIFSIDNVFLPHLLSCTPSGFKWLALSKWGPRARLSSANWWDVWKVDQDWCKRSILATCALNQTQNKLLFCTNISWFWWRLYRSNWKSLEMMGGFVMSKVFSRSSSSRMEKLPGRALWDLATVPGWFPARQNREQRWETQQRPDVLNRNMLRCWKKLCNKCIIWLQYITTTYPLSLYCCNG